MFGKKNKVKKISHPSEFFQKISWDFKVIIYCYFYHVRVITSEYRKVVLNRSHKNKFKFFARKIVFLFPNG
jgi:hypothetical protein